MAEPDLYIYDEDREDFVPNPELTSREQYGEVGELIGGEIVVLSYEQLQGYSMDLPGGDASGSLYPPGAFYLVSQKRHIAVDGTIRVDVVVEIADDMPGKQYELRVTRQ